MTTNKYFPSINEFVIACNKTEKPIKVDAEYSRCLARRKELEDKLYDGEFRSSDWIQLSNDFIAIDKTHASERCLQRVAQMEHAEK